MSTVHFFKNKKTSQLHSEIAHANEILEYLTRTDTISVKEDKCKWLKSYICEKIKKILLHLSEPTLRKNKTQLILSSTTPMKIQQRVKKHIFVVSQALSALCHQFSILQRSK